VGCAPDFLGKVLVRNTAHGRTACVIYDVEAYPAFCDEVHHGNTRSTRAEVMWGPPGHAYVYVAYGVWHQFAVVVATQDVPDVVFVRAAEPCAGIDLMVKRWVGEPPVTSTLCASPGKLCRSMDITRELYGADLCGSELHLTDAGITVDESLIHVGRRVGINPRRRGHDAPLRYRLRRRDILALMAEAGSLGGG
jgi:DNA-3-methyladenine glycosylase